MAELKWRGRQKRRGDDINDVISGDYFEHDDRPSLPLIREAMQNAIDAGRELRKKGGCPVRVRVALNTGDQAMDSVTAEKWFGGLRPHLNAPKNGLREVPEPDDTCSFLVLEDFGTCGLTGDITSDDADGKQNNFVDFLRSDGRTRKAEGEQGSWGVGKNVFPNTSLINAYIACTKRHDDGQCLIMGKCVLKIRRVDEIQYQPPIYFGDSWDDDDVPMPNGDSKIVTELRHDFGITRDEAPGLSLVIPYIDPSMQPEHLLEDLVSQYYYAILSGELEVEIVLNGDGIELTADTIEQVASECKSLEPYRAEIELASWAIRLPHNDFIHLDSPTDPKGAQRWSIDQIPEKTRDKIKELLDRRERVAIRVPIYVRKKRKDAELTHFDVYVEYTDENIADQRPRFFRERLFINKVSRAAGAPKIRSLVVIHEKLIADLLRAAEPPNHSDWSASTSNIKGVYMNGSSVLTYVKTAVRSILSFVRATGEDPDPTIAIDYFFKDIDSAPLPGRKKVKKNKGTDPDPPPPPPPPPSPKRFRMSKVDSGFRLSHGEEGASDPGRITVSIAYDVYEGSPWKRYDEADFDLTKKDRTGIHIVASENANYEILASNRIAVDTTGRPFEVFVTGFDANRDLIVKARAERGGD